MVSNLSRPKKPRDVIPHLKMLETNPAQYEVRSNRMAELAKRYHDTLQNEGRQEGENNELEAKIEEILKEIPDNQKFPNPESSSLSREVTEEKVEEALRCGKNGSATGLDGCPYELWKVLKKKNDKKEKARKTGFNVIKALTKVFQKIQNQGIETETYFVDGWMCLILIYKKKDRSHRTLIEDYRPITLPNLARNSDYKLLTKAWTKALTLQLIDLVKPMIHRDQAGFIPGHSIFDHIRLTRIMTKFQVAEVSERN